MRLGMVGHGEDKFTPELDGTAQATFNAMVDVVTAYGATTIVSGHSPRKGVDHWAEVIADMLCIPADIKAPRQFSWGGEYGYKARNIDIALSSDVVVCFVVARYPPGYRGMRFSKCYHCHGHNPPHVKSGGCWTAWQAKERAWVIIE